MDDATNYYAPAIAMNQAQAQRRALLAQRLMQALQGAPAGGGGGQLEAGSVGGAAPSMGGGGTGMDMGAIAQAFRGYGNKTPGGFSDKELGKPDPQGSWGGLLDTIGGWFGTAKGGLKTPE
jgi:hypothetical protein